MLDIQHISRIVGKVEGSLTMTEAKIDPRILRTRKLIMDSFMELSSKKEFKDITIKDITTEAKINRATFYYHFEDIYDLLEKVLSEVLFVNLNDFYKNHHLNEEGIVHIFIAITNFQKSLSDRCHRGYEETISRIIREQLEIIFYKMLLKQTRNEDNDEALKVTAVILSWGIYGASVEWRRNSKIPPDSFIKSVIPYIMSGIHVDANT